MVQRAISIFPLLTMQTVFPGAACIRQLFYYFKVNGTVSCQGETGISGTGGIPAVAQEGLVCQQHVVAHGANLKGDIMKWPANRIAQSSPKSFGMYEKALVLMAQAMDRMQACFEREVK